MQVSLKSNMRENKPMPMLRYDIMEEITRELSADCAMLFQYYYNKPTEWEYRLVEIAKTMNWSLNKTKRLRTQLRQAGYLYWFQAKGNKYTYIGKSAVEQGISDESDEKK